MKLERLSKPLCVQANTLEQGLLIPLMPMPDLDYSMELVVCQPVGLAG